MYLDFYQFNKAPFLVTPDPEFLFLSPSHQAALGAIAYGIENRQGFVVIVGEVGVGKTTILRSYLERVDPQLKIIFVLHSHITFVDLLKIISRACGLQEDTNDTSAWLDHFQRFLLTQQQRHNVALIIDEAQSLPLDTLEQLRLLSNLGTPKERLLQVVLAGQPELKAKLQREDLQHVGQDILIRATILPLTKEESQLYIYHRLAKVNAQLEAVFAPAALQRIVRYAKGVPRVLNILCTNALIAGYGLQQKPIGPSLIEEIIADLSGKHSIQGLRLGLAGAAGAALLGSAFWLYTASDRTLLRHDKPLPAVEVHLALPRTPDTALTPSAAVSPEPPSPLLRTAARAPDTSASERQVPSAPRATIRPELQPPGIDIPQKHFSALFDEGSTKEVPDRTVAPDEQSPLRQSSASNGGARHPTEVSRERYKNPSAQRQARTVSLGVGSRRAPVPGRRAQAQAQTLAASRHGKRVVSIGKTVPRKARERRQYDSGGMSFPSPYSRSDDTGSSW